MAITNNIQFSVGNVQQNQQVNKCKEEDNNEDILYICNPDTYLASEKTGIDLSKYFNDELSQEDVETLENAEFEIRESRKYEKTSNEKRIEELENEIDEAELFDNKEKLDTEDIYKQEINPEFEKENDKTTEKADYELQLILEEEEKAKEKANLDLQNIITGKVNNQTEKSENNETINKGFLEANIDEVKYQTSQAMKLMKNLINLNFDEAIKTLKEAEIHNLDLQINNVQTIRNKIFGN